MRLTDNDFQLFGLPERQAQVRADIDARWKSLQAEVHPDRFASEGAAAGRCGFFRNSSRCTDTRNIR